MIKRSEAQWRELFRQHKQSGLSAAAFCREHSLCPKYFSLRKKQLGDKPAFVQVKSKPQTPAIVPQEPKATVHIRVIELEVPLSGLSEAVSSLLAQGSSNAVV